MKRTLMALLCALILVTGTLPTAAALEGEALRTADTLSTLRVLEDTDYRLEDTATRGEAAVLLVNLSGGKWAARSGLYTTTFRDVYSIRNEVAYGAHQGWFAGVTAAAFCLVYVPAAYAGLQRQGR